MRDTLKAISENTTVSFGVLVVIGTALVAGYNKVLTVEFKADTVATANGKLEERVMRLEQGQTDMQSIKTDIAVIKTNIENIQKNLPLSQGRK